MKTNKNKVMIENQELKAINHWTKETLINGKLCFQRTYVTAILDYDWKSPLKYNYENNSYENLIKNKNWWKYLNQVYGKTIVYFL